MGNIAKSVMALLLVVALTLAVQGFKVRGNENGRKRNG